MKVVTLGALLAVVLLGTAAQCERGGGGSEQADAPLVGFADFHNHEFAYLGFGGRMISHPVDPSAGCITVPTARQELVVRQLITNGLFEEANKQPSGQCFPTATNLASQRVDTANLKRAWQYGLRLIVMLALNSELLCKIVGLPTCDTDRQAVERQIQAAYDLQDKIDAEAGGPGQGWYRIVTTSAEARQVVRDKKLAVVLGIEAGNAFGCRTEKTGTIVGIEPAPLPGAAPDEPTYGLVCNNVRDIPWTSLVSEPPRQADETVGVLGEQKALALFEHYWNLGVRHFFLTHNQNGIAGGTALSEMILHATHNPAEIENGQSPLFDRKDDINRVFSSARPPFVSAPCLPLYEFDGGVCNQQGLSATGRELATLMAAHGALIDSDHLSWRARRQLMNDDGLLKGIYPMISSHSGAAPLNHGNGKNEGELSEEDINQIIRLKGAFAPRLPTAGTVADQDTYPAGTPPIYSCGGTSESWVQVYRYLVDKIRQDRPGALVGIGIGTDMGAPIPFFDRPRFYKPGNETVTGDFDPSLLVVGGPVGKLTGKCYAEGAAEPAVSYPLENSAVVPAPEPLKMSTTPWDGRDPYKYDISFDGVVHIGMLPDFIEELLALGMTQEDLQPLWHGAEAYIRTWNIAEGFASEFDVEKERRQTCESQRQRFLEAVDEIDIAKARDSLQELKTNACRGRHGN